VVLSGRADQKRLFDGQTIVSFAGALRHELANRAAQYAATHELPHCHSYGQSATVCFESYDGDLRNGNFISASYKAIVRNPNWRRRLRKVHSQGQKSLPRHERGRIWRELDACTSSDALLMNVFCYPRVLRHERIRSLLNIRPKATPEFGFLARVPLTNGKVDRTEVDMRLDQLLIEAKLTESNFQRSSKDAMDYYCDFRDVFDCDELPQNAHCYFSYQLLRNVLAAHSADQSFCVLTDARRPELIEAWYAVMKCIRPVELRARCKVLAWQELAKVLPTSLQKFLEAKYGIV
jgi:hypothetical protein